MLVSLLVSTCNLVTRKTLKLKSDSIFLRVCVPVFWWEHSRRWPLIDVGCNNTYLTVITPWIPAKTGHTEMQLYTVSGFSHSAVGNRMISNETSGGWKEQPYNVCLLHLDLLKTLEGGRRKLGVENVVLLCLLSMWRGIKGDKVIYSFEGSLKHMNENQQWYVRVTTIVLWELKRTPKVRSYKGVDINHSLMSQHGTSGVDLHGKSNLRKTQRRSQHAQWEAKQSCARG